MSAFTEWLWTRGVILEIIMKLFSSLKQPWFLTKLINGRLQLLGRHIIGFQSSIR